tara:strand:+ start:509 stop:952 length:444 start_codon:yes stop_codon:yes gene_type:complete
MQPIPVTIADETVLVPRLRVQQIIELSTHRHERDRLDLIKDLEDSGASTEERLEMLRDHRNQAGLSSIIVRSAFTVDGAYSVIEAAMGGEFPASFSSLEPTLMSKIALQCLGVDVDEIEKSSKAEGRAEGKGSETIDGSGSATAISS